MYFDGTSRGNPGPAGTGFAIYDWDWNLVLQGRDSVGLDTNNAGEYQALIKGIEECTRIEVKRVGIRGDSQLIVNQVLGKYKIGNPALGK